MSEWSIPEGDGIPPDGSYQHVHPNPPEEITIGQVRTLLGGLPSIRLVVLSSAFLRPAAADSWLQLAADVTTGGCRLHFAPGVASWEAWYSLGQVEPPHQNGPLHDNPMQTPLDEPLLQPALDGGAVEPEGPGATALVPGGRIELEDRIRALAREDPELSYRKIAARLLEDGIEVSHMTVARVLRRTPRASWPLL